MIGIAVAAAVLSVTIRPFTQCVVAVWDLVAFGRVRQEVSDRIRALQTVRPGTVAPSVWEKAQGWVQTANANVCAGQSHVTLPDLIRFRDDLRATLREPVDLATLVWIWERLGRTGPHGEKYIRRFDRDFRATLSPSGAGSGP